jgi:ubiquinone/menaquinone biosynthesis C-methylase UbiE
MNRKEHWEKVYSTKELREVSWYQPNPKASLDFIAGFNLPKDASIIDIGGGDSFLTDRLLDSGFTNITVLDISEAAINRAKQRLGNKAGMIKWIVSDITEFDPTSSYDFWHDRATFHFLTTTEEIEKYIGIAAKAVKGNGKMLIGTFSENGPEQCSGLLVKQYSEETLVSLIKNWFMKIRCIHTDHITPFNSVQNFLFCSFKKLNSHGLS